MRKSETRDGVQHLIWPLWRAT